MSICVAVVAQGAMGAGIGGVLSAHGVDVVTSLSGRSAASARRAQEARMRAVEDADLVGADIVLSIVPPGEAMAFAQRLAPLLSARERKPAFIDCNAVSPRTVGAIAEVIGPTGASFADAAIIGAPPKHGTPGPSIYACGAAAPALTALRDHGLDIRLLDGPVGAASAFKMSYGGISKGLTALGAAMMLAATRAGAAQAFRSELAESQPALTPWFEQQIPKMYDKAYRFVAEMREVSSFLEADPAASALFEAVAQFYERMAQDAAGDRYETAILDAFLALDGNDKPKV